MNIHEILTFIWDEWLISYAHGEPTDPTAHRKRSTAPGQHVKTFAFLERWVFGHGMGQRSPAPPKGWLKPYQ